MTNRKRSLLALAAVATLSAITQAAPLDVKSVPGDAKWVLHVDADALSKSETWKMIEPKLAARPQFVKSKADLERLFAVKLPAALHGVTLFGPSFGDKEAVVVIHADVDPERVKTLLSINEHYTSQTIGGQTVYGWQDDSKGGDGGSEAELKRLREQVQEAEAQDDAMAKNLGTKHPSVVRHKAEHQVLSNRLREAERNNALNLARGKQLYGVLPAAGTMIVGQNADRVAAAGDVLSGKAKSIDNDVLKPKDESGLLVYVAGDQIATLAQGGMARSPVVGKLQSAVLTASEMSDGLKLSGHVVAQDEAVAKNILQAVEGVRSWVAFAQPDNPDAALAGELLTNLTAKQTGKSVDVELTVAMGTVSALIDRATEEKAFKLP